jgi:peroxiredoxin
MNHMQEKYGDQGLVIIGVNLDSDPEEAEAFLKDVPADFEIVRDPSGELAKAYDVIAMPSSFVFDRDGNVAERHNGFKVRKQDEYESILIKLLTQSKETG